jgi:hypothetical protein
MLELQMNQEVYFSHFELKIIDNLKLLRILALIDSFWMREENKLK